MNFCAYSLKLDREFSQFAEELGRGSVVVSPYSSPSTRRTRNTQRILRFLICHRPVNIHLHSTVHEPCLSKKRPTNNKEEETSRTRAETIIHHNQHQPITTLPTLSTNSSYLIFTSRMNIPVCAPTSSSAPSISTLSHLSRDPK